MHFREGSGRLSDVELVVDCRDDVGESPRWDDRAQALLWVDVSHGTVHRYDPATADLTEARLPEVVSSLALRESGGYVVTMGEGLFALGADLRLGERLAALAPAPGCFLNDSGVDPAGGLWVGSGSETVGADGTLVRVGTTGQIDQVLTGFALANGIGWSPDGRTAYLADSLAGVVYAFAFETPTASLANRRVFYTAGPDDGLPDGLAVDAEGGVWIAFWGGWCVRRYLPDGRLDRTYRLPVAQVASCAFGGPSLRDLYITTARYELDEADRAAQPTAGGLFRLATDVAGYAPAKFAG